MLNYIKTIAFFLVLFVGMYIGSGAWAYESVAPEQVYGYVIVEDNIKEANSIEEGVSSYFTYSKTIELESNVYNRTLSEITVFGDKPVIAYREKIPNDNDSDAARLHVEKDMRSSLISYTTVINNDGKRAITMVDPESIQKLVANK